MQWTLGTTIYDSIKSPKDMKYKMQPNQFFVKSRQLDFGGVVCKRNCKSICQFELPSSSYRNPHQRRNSFQPGF